MTDTPDHLTPTPAPPPGSPDDQPPGVDATTEAPPQQYGGPQAPPVGFTPPPFRTQGQSPPTHSTQPHSTQPHWTQRYLVRSREERMIAGVAGGVARRLGVDPLIVRILLVVLAFFGGVGILLYGLGWLLLPDDDGRERSLLEDTTSSRSPTRTRNVLLVAALVTAIVISGVWVLSGHLIPVVLLALTMTALYLYARRDNFQPAWSGPWDGAPVGNPPAQSYGSQPARAGAQAATPSAAPRWGARAYAGPSPISTDPYAATDPYATTDPYAATGPSTTIDPYAATGPSAATDPYAATTPVGSHQYVPTSAYPPSSYPSTPPPGGRAPGPGVAPPKRPKPPRERSYLGLLTISAALVALGVLAAVDASGATVPGTGYVGTALGVVALGLLVGAWVGRSRGLIFLGLALCVVMVPAAVADTATDDDWSRIGDWSSAETLRESPTLATDILPAYDLGSGRLVLDLRQVDFTGSDTATTLTIGAGEITVLLPEDVDVTVDGTADMGAVILFGDEAGGVDVDADKTDLGADGVGGGQLDLTIDVNVGHAEVRREAA